jgi:hypothetical protein
MLLLPCSRRPQRPFTQAAFFVRKACAKANTCGMVMHGREIVRHRGGCKPPAATQVSRNHKRSEGARTRWDTGDAVSGLSRRHHRQCVRAWMLQNTCDQEHAHPCHHTWKTEVILSRVKTPNEGGGGGATAQSCVTPALRAPARRAAAA